MSECGHVLGHMHTRHNHVLISIALSPLVVGSPQAEGPVPDRVGRERHPSTTAHRCLSILGRPQEINGVENKAAGRQAARACTSHGTGASLLSLALSFSTLFLSLSVPLSLSLSIYLSIYPSFSHTLHFFLIIMMIKWTTMYV